MKKLNFIIALLTVALLLGLSACFGPDCGPQSLRIKRFQWYETVYYAKYNAAGRLVKLQAADRDLLFFYDENRKLYKAEYNIYGQPSAQLVYTYTHGPLGIVETTLYEAPVNGVLSHPVNIKKYHYITPTKFSSVEDINLGYFDPDTPYVIFQQNLLFIYNGENVIRSHEIPVFTDYNAYSYDRKPNPFRMLGEAVGNPAFFPVGVIANYPITDFNIPLISIFSKNNPLTARYWIEEVPITAVDETFTYTYDNNGLVKRILWTGVDFYSNVYTGNFAFEYELGPALQ